jgi:hypothetical protein
MLAWSQMELGTLAWASLWVAGGSLSASSTHTKKKNGTKSKLHPREGTCWGYHRARIVPTLLLRKYVAESLIRIVLHDAPLERLELLTAISERSQKRRSAEVGSWLDPPKQTTCFQWMSAASVFRVWTSGLDELVAFDLNNIVNFKNSIETLKYGDLWFFKERSYLLWHTLVVFSLA